jgi:hypothetical protein
MTPKPNEVWRTKSNRLALVVEGPSGETGFVWHNEEDNILVYCPLTDQLESKTSKKISSWGIVVENRIPEAATMKRYRDAENNTQPTPETMG